VAVIIQQYDITKGSITIALDGESALDQVSSETPLKINQADFDILQDIQERLHILPIKVKWKWVEGLPDKKGKTLDWWALQNQKRGPQRESIPSKMQTSKQKTPPILLAIRKMSTLRKRNQTIKNKQELTLRNLICTTHNTILGTPS
jgi:hypothetical protein